MGGDRPLGAGGTANSLARAVTAALVAAALLLLALDPTGYQTRVPAAVAALALLVLLLRWGVWSWLSAVSSLPALLVIGAANGTHAPREAVLVALVCLALLLVGWRGGRRVLAAGLPLVVLAVLLGVALGGEEGPSWPLSSWLVGAVAVVVALALLGPRVGRSPGGSVSGLLVVALLAVLAPWVTSVLFVTPLTSGGLTLQAASIWAPTLTLALTYLLRGRRGAATMRPQSGPWDDAAVVDVGRRLAGRRLAPVTIVIAAWNEAAGLPAVLDELPRTVLGLGVDVVVVDDGSTDGTDRVVATHPRALLVSPEVNRGQGAALRLGYRVAREHGAEYVVTTDADGQYDPSDLPALLAPLVEGTADLVTGSRRLGAQESHDRVRRLGVHVFAWTVTLMTGRWITDTSFGLRAMRAEVTGAVTLNQPQYQSSELMLGVISHGYRVREVPAVMRTRTAGVSKKGGNLVYGSRYARVVWGTWWREGCPRPAPEAAPALSRRGHDDPIRRPVPVVATRR